MEADPPVGLVGGDGEPQLADGEAGSGRAFRGHGFRRAFARDDRPRRPADLVVLRYDPPTPLSSANAAGHWAFGLHAGLVRDVFIAGERVVADGEPTRVDAQRVLAESRRVAATLWQHVADVGPRPFIPAVSMAPNGGATALRGGMAAGESRG